jgi:N-acetylmuramoyl-L-alanine amidase
MMTVTTRLQRTACAALVVAVLAPVDEVLAATSARTMYTRALSKERELRQEAKHPTLRQLRSAIQAYRNIVRRYPRSGYSDNALWQAGNLALLTYERFEQAADRETGTRLLRQLRREYSSSSLVSRVAEVIEQFETVRVAVVRRLSERPARSAATAARAPAPDAVPASSPAPAAAGDPPATDSTDPVTIRAITRTSLPDGVRVSIEMERELFFRQDQLQNPRRVFFDLKGARAAAPLFDATLKFENDVVREIRLGRHPQNVTRVVMDMQDVESYSVFTLYEPFRVIVDFKRRAGIPAPPAAAAPSAVAASVAAPPAPALTPTPKELPGERTPVPAPPAAPSANATGSFSLSRQLGLGISRIVIDAGHGGHDPGAKANGVTEAELVLDVSLRLRKLLEKQPGVEVVLTRSTNVFIPLEERTAIANREGADLFLSVHANASRRSAARGVETYFLNFASNPEAEAVAARENATSSKRMHSLPDIVRAIALNNKIDESRDFATMVQKAMVRRLSARNRSLRDLGVKQAPFVVLIGAGMPSVLAEISFVTNKREASLLKTGAYRQQIAEALFDAIQAYQKSLKRMTTVAAAPGELEDRTTVQPFN